MPNQKDIRLEMRVRNNCVLTRMEKMGIESVAELCRKAGLEKQQGLVGDLINFKKSPLLKQGRGPGSIPWRKIALQIAQTLECLPEDLFPESLQEVELESNRAMMEMGVDEIRQLSEAANAVLLPDQVVEQHELVEAVQKAVSTLSPRQKEVLTLHFGLGDQEQLEGTEIAELLGISRSAVSQYLQKGVRMLKRRARDLRSYA